jgi:phosphoribosylformimino-5-aminoimidazole carboxamide ribotide isomerase
MRIVPVLDIKNGVVVRGIAGRRENYRPIVSQLTSSSFPVDLAKAFRDQLGLREIYLADLDAIGGQEPCWKIYGDIRSLGCRLWVDAGIRNVSDAHKLLQGGISDIVIGLETLAGPTEVKAICDTLESEQIIFSLDLKHGKPLGNVNAWSKEDAYPIANEAIGFGIRRLIILDLAMVGRGRGLGTEELCRRIAKVNPSIEICAGGGIQGPEDFSRLAECGVQTVLIASALHDGRLRPKHWQGNR